MASAEDRLAAAIRRVYRQAAQEVSRKIAVFNQRHKARDAEMQRMLAAGKITRKDYQDWLRGQVFTGERWQEKLDDITRVYVDADAKARELVNGTRKDVFTQTANSTAREMTKGLDGAVSFDIYDRTTVERLIRDDPKMLPEWKIDEPKDYTWNEKRVRNAVTQGIVQGESVYDVGKRLTSELATSNAKKMNTFARTAVTGAQNAGRLQRMHEAEDMGIKVKKKWLTAHDKRVRDAHIDLDGDEKDIDQPFHNEIGDIMYPGDPTADPANVYNCRCTLTYVYPKYQKR